MSIDLRTDVSRLVIFIILNMLNLKMIIRLHRCWWRMLETKYVGDNFEMLVTVLAVFVTNILYILALVQPSTTKRCHQYRNSVTKNQKFAEIKWPTLTFHQHLPHQHHQNLCSLIILFHLKIIRGNYMYLPSKVTNKLFSLPQ